MKEEIRIQASKNQKRKSEILSSNEGIESNSDFSNFTGVEPDFNLENDKVSSLPLKEQETLKKQAMESLITELNPDGKNDITITNEQFISSKIFFMFFYEPVCIF